MMRRNESRPRVEVRPKGAAGKGRLWGEHVGDSGDRRRRRGMERRRRWADVIQEESSVARQPAIKLQPSHVLRSQRHGSLR
jgi:hypothetical protein